MFCRFHFGKDRSDFSLGIDDIGRAFGAHVFFPIHGFFNPDSICLDDAPVGVGEKRKWKVEFRDEFLVRFYRVDADTEEGGTRALDQLPGIADTAGLGGASRSIILGVKIEDYRPALQIAEGEGSAVTVAAAYGSRGEGGGFVANFGWGAHDGTLLSF